MRTQARCSNEKPQKRTLTSIGSIGPCWRCIHARAVVGEVLTSSCCNVMMLPFHLHWTRTEVAVLDQRSQDHPPVLSPPRSLRITEPVAQRADLVSSGELALTNPPA